MLKEFCIGQDTIIKNTVYSFKNKTWKPKENTDI